MGPGTLPWVGFADAPELAGVPVASALRGWARAVDVRLAPIDPDLADTAEFCAAYGVELADSANCVVVAGRRGEEIRYAACLVLATDRADVNGAIRRRLGARKASFAAMDDAVAATGMEYGGITPIGVPDQWPVLVDSRVLTRDVVVVGSGLRRSKIALPAAALLELPGAEILA